MTNASTTNHMVDAIQPSKVLDSLRRTHDEVAGLVAATPPAQMDDPTPCAKWNVRTLINHLIQIDRRIGAMANGDEMPNPADDFIAENPSSSPAQLYKDAASYSAAAFARPGVLDQTYSSPWGEVPGSVLAQHLVNELIAHGWDLAIATGRSADLLPDLAEESLRIWRTWFDEIGRQDAMFEPERKPSPDATAAGRVAAFLGRKT